VDFAHRAHQANNVVLGRELLELCPERLQNWEWRYIRRLCHSELIILAGHTDPISSVSWSPDGRRVLTSSHDNTARVWDPVTGKSLVTFAKHVYSLATATWSPDGKRVVSAGGDAHLRVWDPDTGMELVVLKGHKMGPYTATWNPDGTRIVSASSEKTACVWDANDGKPLATFSTTTGLPHHLGVQTAFEFSLSDKAIPPGYGILTMERHSLHSRAIRQKYSPQPGVRMVGES
jgi:WD40 repeat protein